MVRIDRRPLVVVYLVRDMVIAGPTLDRVRERLARRGIEPWLVADAAARTRGLRLVPGVMPGYDDTPLRGADRVTINRRRGDFYRESWRVASRFISSGQPLLLVTSFNEWHDGTEIEPYTEFGERFLGITRELVGQLRGGSASSTQDRQPP